MKSKQPGIGGRYTLVFWRKVNQNRGTGNMRLGMLRPVAGALLKGLVARADLVTVRLHTHSVEHYKWKVLWKAYLVGTFEPHTRLGEGEMEN